MFCPPSVAAVGVRDLPDSARRLLHGDTGDLLSLSDRLANVALQCASIILNADDHELERVAHEGVSVDQSGGNAAVSTGGKERHALQAELLALMVQLNHRRGVAQRASAGRCAVADGKGTLSLALVLVQQLLHVAIAGVPVAGTEKMELCAEKLSQQEIPLLVRRLIAVDDQLTGKIDSRAGRRSQCAKVGLHRTGGQYLRRSRLKSLAQYEFQTADLVSAGADARHVVSLDPQGHILARRGGVQWVERSGRRHQLDAGRVL